MLQKIFFRHLKMTNFRIFITRPGGDRRLINC